METIRFDPINHKYYLGDKELISVTTLMVKHGLAPSYEGVKTSVLEKSAAKGTLVHKEIEDFIKRGEIGFTTELTSFIDYCTANDITPLASEKIVHNDICAGTCDFLCRYNKLNKTVRVDFKTTSTVHKKAVSWQLSLYDDMDDVKADALEVWHFSEDGSLEVKDIPFVTNENVSKLFNDERNGNLPTVSINTNELAIVTEAQGLYDQAAEMKKKADELLANIKDTLIRAFEENNLKTFENDYIRITYVAPSVREGVDGTRLKKDHPDLYTEYTKRTNVSATLKITRKGESK